MDQTLEGTAMAMTLQELSDRLEIQDVMVAYQHAISHHVAPGLLPE
jgi:hypothetical protein